MADSTEIALVEDIAHTELMTVEEDDDDVLHTSDNVNEPESEHEHEHISETDVLMTEGTDDADENEASIVNSVVDEHSTDNFDFSKPIVAKVSLSLVMQAHYALL